MVVLTGLPGPPSAGAGGSAHTRELVYDLDGRRVGPGDPDILDLYTPATANRRDARGVVVYVHGGGWMWGDKRHGVRRKARLFTRAGYLFASVDYRLSPNPPQLEDPQRVRFPAHPRDVGEAVAWLHENVARFGGDGRRMVLIGHSAGAHLAALVATSSRYLRAFGSPPSVVRGFVSLDAVALQVRRAIRGAATPARRALLLNAFGTPAEERARPRWADASPLSHAGRRDPRALVVQRDTPAPLEPGRRFAHALGGGTRLLRVAMRHNQIDAALGRGGAARPLTDAVVGFVNRVLRRDPS